MAIKLAKTFAGAPNVERGRTASLTTDPEGKKMVYPSGNVIVIRDIENPEDILLYTDHTCKARAAQFSPSGYFVASTDEQGHLRIWGLNDDLTLKKEVQLVTQGGRDIAWTGDSKRVMYVGKGAKVFGAAIFLETGTQVGSISNHSEEGLSVACRPERPYKVITTSEDFTTVQYKGPPYKFEKTIEGHTKYVNQVRYAPDGSVFVTVSSDKTIRVCDGKEGTFIREMKGHKGTIYSVAFSPDSKKIVTSSADKTCKIWNVETGEELATMAFEKTVENMQLAAQWFANGPASLALSGDITFFDENNTEKPTRVISGHNELPSSIAHKGDQLFTCSKDGVLVWDAEKGATRIHGKGHENNHVTSVGVTSSDLVTVGLDGQVIFTPLDRLTFDKADPRVSIKGESNSVVVTNKDVVYVSTNRAVYVIVNKQIVQEFDSCGFEPTQITVNSDGNRIAIAGHRRIVHVYGIGDDHQIQKEATKLEEHLKQITAVAFSPDGSKLATGDKDREINVWDVANGSTIATSLSFHSASVDNISWLDNDHFVSSGQDAKIILWKHDSKFPIHKVEETHYLQNSFMTVFGEGKIASVGADNALKIWSVDTEKP